MSAFWRGGDGRLDPDLLRVVAITDGRGEARRIERLVGLALSAGVRCLYLREPGWSASEQAEFARRLRPRCETEGAILLVRDGLEAVAEGAAHGCWLGRRSPDPERARARVGDDAVLAFAAHDAEELALAKAIGCDFASLSPVWPTSCKPVAEPLGPELAEELSRAAALPVVWLGGVSAASSRGVSREAAGVAVRSAWAEAVDPAAVLRELLGP